MKKVLCFAAAAITIFASCQKTEIVYNNDGPQEIAMFAVNRAASKAPIASETYPTDYDMVVAAYLAEGGNTTGDFFNGTTFKSAAQGTDPEIYRWTGSRYWPLTYSKINFLAVSQPKTEYTGAGTVSTSFTTPFAKNATVTFAKNEVTSDKFNQFDLMYAAGHGNHSSTSPYPEVNMKFQHALSWINFTVAKNNVEASITINSIQLHGAHYGGKLTLTNDKFNATSTFNTSDAITISNTSWTEHTTKVDNVYVPNTAANNKADAVTCNYGSSNNFGNGLMVVPKTYTSDYPSITINYTITQGDVSTSYDYTYTFASSGDFVWEPGKKYTYNITLNLNEIKIAPSVTPWTDASSSNIFI